MKFLKTANPELQKAAKRGLKEAVSNPILPDAKRRAGSIADDGTFAASLSVASRANGASWDEVKSRIDRELEKIMERANG